MNITINILEAASELAEKELELRFLDSYESLYKEDGENYLDDVQDAFNELYEEYYDLLWNLKEEA